MGSSRSRKSTSDFNTLTLILLRKESTFTSGLRNQKKSNFYYPRVCFSAAHGNVSSEKFKVVFRGEGIALLSNLTITQNNTLMRTAMSTASSPRRNSALESNIQRIGNQITVGGKCHLSNSELLFAEIHKAVDHAGYQDIVIDFRSTEAFFADIAVPLCALIVEYKKRKITFELKFDARSKLENTFINSNWAHIINDTYPESSYKGYLQHPAVVYRDDTELVGSLNNILECMLKSATSLTRPDLAVLEWALNEIMENSLRHSESKAGGIVHLSRFDKTRKVIEIVVADGGKGIPTTLGEAEKFKGLTDLELLELAIQEGVTNGKGMGNGLFGASQTSIASGGAFCIRSQYAILSLYKDKSGSPAKYIGNRRIPFMGTTVIASYDYSSPGVLESALKFKGKIHSLETDYIGGYEGECLIKLKDEVKHFSTRLAAEGLRAKVISLTQLVHIQRITFDLQEIPVMSSSFADELFGKMKILLGEDSFWRIVRFINIGETNRTILERAVHQRTFI